jgi:hypothetical protein
VTPLEEGIHQAINRRRARDGLRPLASDPALVLAAREHSASMARLRFFAHGSPVPGRENPTLRAAAAGAEFVEVGENLALLSRSIATADGFLQGWLDSPPHRENLLRPGWECSGVGVHAGGSLVHATQLFSVLPDVRLDPLGFVASGHPLVSLRAEFHLERPGELGILLSGACVASAVSDARGKAAVRADLPVDHARHPVTFAARAVAGAGGWSELVGGRMAARPSGWEWVHERGPFAGVRQWDVDIGREAARTHHLWHTGTARRPSTVVVVVDGYFTREVQADGAFAVFHDLPARGGVREVNVGVRGEGNQYQPVRSLTVDTDRGSVAERPLAHPV